MDKPNSCLSFPKLFDVDSWVKLRVFEAGIDGRKQFGALTFHTLVKKHEVF